MPGHCPFLGPLLTGGWPDFLGWGWRWFRSAQMAICFSSHPPRLSLCVQKRRLGGGRGVFWSEPNNLCLPSSHCSSEDRGWGGRRGTLRMGGWAVSLADARNGSSSLQGADWGGEGLSFQSPPSVHLSLSSSLPHLGVPLWSSGVSPPPTPAPCFCLPLTPVLRFQGAPSPSPWQGLPPPPAP